jgi:hypothetical protein
MIAEQTGAAKPRAIALPSHAFFSEPWSPDGKQLLLEDSRELWAITSAAARREARHRHLDDPGRRFDAVWSPDSQWIAY